MWRTSMWFYNRCCCQWGAPCLQPARFLLLLLLNYTMFCFQIDNAVVTISHSHRDRRTAVGCVPACLCLCVSMSSVVQILHSVLYAQYLHICRYFLIHIQWQPHTDSSLHLHVQHLLLVNIEIAGRFTILIIRYIETYKTQAHIFLQPFGNMVHGEPAAIKYHTRRSSPPKCTHWSPLTATANVYRLFASFLFIYLLPQNQRIIRSLFR